MFGLWFGLFVAWVGFGTWVGAVFGGVDSVLLICLGCACLVVWIVVIGSLLLRLLVLVSWCWCWFCGFSCGLVVNSVVIYISFTVGVGICLCLL